MRFQFFLSALLLCSVSARQAKRFKSFNPANAWKNIERYPPKSSMDIDFEDESREQLLLDHMKVEEGTDSDLANAFDRLSLKRPRNIHVKHPIYIS